MKHHELTDKEKVKRLKNLLECHNALLKDDRERLKNTQNAIKNLRKELRQSELKNLSSQRILVLYKNLRQKIARSGYDGEEVDEREYISDTDELKMLKAELDKRPHVPKNPAEARRMKMRAAGK